MIRSFLIFTCMIAFNASASYLADRSSSNDFILVGDNIVAPLLLEPSAEQGVRYAVTNLQEDIAAVTGKKPSILSKLPSRAASIVLIGQLGKSPLIQQLLDAKKLDLSQLKGKWDAYHIEHVLSPFEGIDAAWVIIGNDKRGATYGVYDLSKTIGVSPWHWWADVAINKQETIKLEAGTRIFDFPKVKYRGIFLNDEAPALTGWSHEKFGGYNAQFYQHVFELLLRLKGNFLWPAMWNNAFADDDPQNAILANEMGIVMSTSHHEPMMRADKEWNRYGDGPWEYSNNPENLYRFWEQGAKRHKDLESIFTLGMRGQEDEPMSEGENIGLLERIVEDQREILAKTFGQENVNKVPQVWALYKEVQGFYERGMRVPDDVTLLWADDNFGNVRRLPTKSERGRKGGAGVYYHFDYVGGPRSYRWINTVPLAKIWEQMDLSYRYGADRIWITNVGDLKPMELPIDFFLTMAWDPAAMDANSSIEFTQKWAEEQFGKQYSQDIAGLLDLYTRHNGRRKPEALTPDTYSISAFDEASRVSQELANGVALADKIASELSSSHQNAFFQLVSYPLKATQAIFELNRNQALNQRYASQNRSSTNQYADAIEYWFKQDQALTDQYHSLDDGRWNHMMSQPRIGYVHWRNPPANIPPTVVRHTPARPAVADMGVALSGSNLYWPANEFTNTPLVMDTFFEYGKSSRDIVIFNRQQAPFDYTATVSDDWIKLSSESGTIKLESLVKVSIDWSSLPPGLHKGSVLVKGTGWGGARIFIEAQKIEGKAKGLVDADGFISIDPAKATVSNNTEQIRWQPIPGHGRFGHSVAGIMPPETSIKNESSAPTLSFDTWFIERGKYEMHIDVAPSLQFIPDGEMRLGIRVNSEQATYLDVGPEASDREWGEDVLDGIRRIKTTINIESSGENTLQFLLKDPGVVIQKIVIYTKAPKDSYLGPLFTQYVQ